MNNGLHIEHHFPSLTALAALLFCAALFITLYQKLFPRPARWWLVILALVLSIALTASYALLLAPGAQRLGQIHDLWSALRVAVLGAGLPEEAIKFLAALIAISLFSRAATPAEAFQACLFTAIGFSIVENSGYAGAFAQYAVLLAFGRGIAASFVHSLLAMIQGTFLARFVATGWRRFHLLLIGYLCAALVHAGFDWGLLRIGVEILTTQNLQPATLLSSLPVLAIGIPTLFISGLWLLRRALHRAGDAEFNRIRQAAGTGSSAELDYLSRLRRWRAAGNLLLILGALVLIAAIAIVVYLKVTGAFPPPADTEQSALAGPQMQASLIVTVGIAGALAALLLGWLLRQKR